MFKCDKCGECCRHLDLSELYNELNRGDGVCKYLVGNLCSIYNERPLICRVDDWYDVYLKNQMSIDDYYEMNYKACEKIKNMI